MFTILLFMIVLLCHYVDAQINGGEEDYNAEGTYDYSHCDYRCNVVLGALFTPIGLVLITLICWRINVLRRYLSRKRIKKHIATDVICIPMPMSTEMHRWEGTDTGSYEENEGNQSISIDLEFLQNGSLLGTGRDEVGNFTIAGFYNFNKVGWIKDYRSDGNLVQYLGEFSNLGTKIQGQWQSLRSREQGTFEIQQQLSVTNIV